MFVLATDIGTTPVQSPALLTDDHTSFLSHQTRKFIKRSALQDLEVIGEGKTALACVIDK